MATRKQKMRTTSVLFVCMMYLVSCASDHPGSVAKTLNTTSDLDLKISAKVNKDYSDTTNVFVDLTFENKSNHWAHIDAVDVDFPSAPNTVHNIIVDQDLKALAQSQAIKEKKSDHNVAMGIGTLIVTGAVLMVVAAASGGKDGNGLRGIATAGLASYGAGATAAVYKNVKDNQKKAERGMTVPENHLLAPSALPSNGYAQKWILINVPGQHYAKSMRLRIHTVEGGVGIYEIPLVSPKQLKESQCTAGSLCEKET